MNTSVTQAPTQVIEAQRSDKGIAFELPFDAAAVAKMEAVDLDLLITLKGGQQFILTQAGLLAMTQPESVLRYAGGLEVLAADEVKQIGAMQSMDANTLRLAGNFRLASLELDENDIDRVSGTGFGLGQELVDITAKLDQSSQKIEQMLQSLEQATQASSLASSGDEPPPAVSTGVKRLSKNTNPDLYSSPTPGTPPQEVKKEDQTNENTSNFTTDNTNNNINNNVNNNTSTADAVTLKVTASLLAANKSDVTFQNVALSQTEVRQLLGKNSVELTMSATAQNLQFEAGKVENQLLLESVPATTSLLVNINDQQPGFKIPDGLTINGQAIRPGTPLTLDVTGMTDNEVPLNLQWEEGAAAAASNFQMTVSYIGPNGETTLKTLTFTGNPDIAYTLDVNGEPRQFITSQAADLVVTANDQNNTITTGNGNDTIKGSGGADTINGGKGTDTVDYSNSAEAITLNAITGAGTGGQAAGDQLSNIERVVGSNATTDTLDFSGAASAVTVDFVNGTTNVGLSFSGFENAIGSAHGDTYVVNNTQFGISESADGLGIDTVQASVDYTLGEHLENLELTGTAVNGTGNASNNTITGNSADNRLDGGAGADTLIGGAGDDTYVVDSTSDVITENAGEGTDTVESSASYTLTANLENLTITGAGDFNGTGNADNNTITGNSGNNRLDGGAGIDTMAGGTGNDTYVVDHINDVVTETVGAGTDTVEASVNYTLSANVENLTLTGSGNINGTGNAANNTITGNSSNNRLDGGAGIDTMIGGAGDDTYVVDNTGDVITEIANEGTDTVESSASYTIKDNIENLILKEGSGNINGTGNGLDNNILGNSGNNFLVGGLGNDTLNGGGGTDTASYTTSANINATLGLNGANGSATGEGTDVLINIENLKGGNGNDEFNGNEKANKLEGGGGNDTLNGYAGNDTLDGGIGADSMTGGLGDDIYVVDNTGDVVVEVAGEGTDTVQSSITYILGENLENLTLTGSNAINGTGNSANNILTGNSSANRLDGGLGADTMAGGAGDDIYVVDNSGDVVTEAASAGTDTIEASVSYTLSANVEKLILKEGSGNIDGTAKEDNNDNNTLIGNTGNNKLSGGGGNDSLIGGEGNDSLQGGAGNDTLVGSAGDDTLNGGTGNDTLDLRTDNTSLMGDRADGDDGNDTIEIAQSQLAPSLTLNTNSISGGTGSDTLQFHASVAGELNLTNILDTNKLNALNSFETLDLSKDSISSKAVISSSLIQGLVDNGNNSSLTLVLSKASGTQDTYTIATSENYSIGQNSSNQTVFTFQDAANIQIAQLTISYV